MDPFLSSVIHWNVTVLVVVVAMVMLAMSVVINGNRGSGKESKESCGYSGVGLFLRLELSLCCFFLGHIYSSFCCFTFQSFQNIFWLWLYFSF